MDKNIHGIKMVFSPAFNICDLGQFTTFFFSRFSNLTGRIIQNKQFMIVRKKNNTNADFNFKWSPNLALPVQI